MTEKKSAAAEPVASVAKALTTLRSFVDGQDEWGVRELGTALGLPPSTVHRLLARLRMEGFVGYDKNHQKYKVGFEFARLSAAVMQRHGLRQAALPLMRELTDRTVKAYGSRCSTTTATALPILQKANRPMHRATSRRWAAPRACSTAPAAWRYWLRCRLKPARKPSRACEARH
jgi:DNA-binding IclR family transcriptional regulator